MARGTGENGTLASALALAAGELMLMLCGRRASTVQCMHLRILGWATGVLIVAALLGVNTGPLPGIETDRFGRGGAPACTVSHAAVALLNGMKDCDAMPWIGGRGMARHGNELFGAHFALQHSLLRLPHNIVRRGRVECKQPPLHGRGRAKHAEPHAIQHVK